MLTSQLATAPLKGKQVLVRADLNVPRNKKGKILNDFKFKALLPTLQLIIMRGGKITLITHSGRPEKKEEHLSTETFVTWFKKHEFSTSFAKTPAQATEQIKTNKFDIVLLENLRFFKEETTENQQFAQKLSELGNYFVQDAFGNLHRNHTSMTLLPEQFTRSEKTIGLLIEKELIILAQLKNPKQPFVALLGGNKPETKLPLIESLLDTVNAILLSPALVFTLLKAQGKQTGRSLVDDNALEAAQILLQKAQQKNVTLVFPVDYIATSNSFEKPFPLEVVKNLSNNHVGISFGPQTTALFKHCIMQARTIFLNGISGNPNYPETVEGMRGLLSTLQQTTATKIIGGGDSVALAQQLGFDQDIGHLLTGGGATLAYLSGKDLPGLRALR